MKLLLDENTPIQLLPVLRQVLDADHIVDHVHDIQWDSKKDEHLIPDAKGRGYDVLVARDSRQLEDPQESKLLKRVGIHHVRFAQGSGRKGLARAIGAVIASIAGPAPAGRPVRVRGSEPEGGGDLGDEVVLGLAVDRDRSQAETGGLGGQALGEEAVACEQVGQGPVGVAGGAGDR